MNGKHKQILLEIIKSPFKQYTTYKTIAYCRTVITGEKVVGESRRCGPEDMRHPKRRKRLAFISTPLFFSYEKYVKVFIEHKIS